MEYYDLKTFPIELDSNEYFIAIDSWNGRDVMDFSPRASVPGTGLVYADLSSYQPIAQTNFQHGLGFIWHDDEAGYLKTQGYVDTRHKNAAMLFTEPTLSDENDAYKSGMIKFGSAMYSWGEDGVRKFASDTWTAVNVKSPHPGTSSEASDDDIANEGTLTIEDVDVDEDYTNKTMLAWIVVDTNAHLTSIGVTCGGDAMAAITGFEVDEAPYINAWYLDDPSDDDDIVFTFAIDDASTVDVAAGAVCIYDCDEGTTFGTAASTSDDAVTTLTDDATVAVRDMVFSVIGKLGVEGDTLTASSAETEIMQDDNPGDNVHVAAFWQTALTTTGTSTYTWTNARDACMAVIGIKPAAEVEVNYMIENGEYLFAFPDGGRVMKSTDGTIWTPAGGNHRSKDYSMAIIHDGYIWAVKDDDNTIYFDSNSDLSDLWGDADDDTDEIDVGPGNVSVLAVASFLEKLIVGREDALYTIDQDADTTAKTTLEFYEERSANNFRDMAVQGGNLYFPIQDKLFSWNGSRLTNITPDWITDSWPYTAYGRFDNFTTYDKWMFMSVRTNVTTYSEDILAYDGAGYHRMVTALSDGDGSITMIAYDDVNNYIWYHVDQPTADTNKTYYIPVDDDSDLPYADFPTTGTNQLETSRIHAGFRRITKSSPVMILYTDNCSNTIYIRVKYKLDGASDWATWSDVRESGVTILELPAGKKSLEFDYIELAFEFITDDATETPVLEGAVMYVMLRPDVKYGYGFSVIAQNYQESDMRQDYRTVTEIKRDIRKARNSKGPVKLLSPFGEEIWGYITSIQESAMEYEPYEQIGGNPNIVMRIDVNFIEVLELEGVKSRSTDTIKEKHE